MLFRSESPELCSKLQKIVSVIKVFSVDDDFNFQELEKYENACDYFFNICQLNVSPLPPCNFPLVSNKKYKSEKPLFLSGGIGIDEIDKIKKLDLPIFAIDINSKFEIEPGLKNIDLCTDAIYRVSHNGI